MPRIALRISATIGAGSPRARANSRSVLTSLRAIGKNKCGRGRSLMLLYFDVGDDADHFGGRPAEPNAAAKRFAFRPVAPRHGLADDDHGARRLRRVGAVVFAAGADRNAHRLEVPEPMVV